jgi:threonine dehydrogenase-like Zn-dependent dehydrogenase
MATVVIDATENLKAIESGLDFLSHGRKYILLVYKREDFSFNHPEFHKRETTLMSSRNFEFVIQSIKNKTIDPSVLITHKVRFDDMKDELDKFADPTNRMIKAIIEFDQEIL